ncbi:hypothetical protein SADUNF_Sadunf06G0223000 [Salix dunnii]|uniref:Sugar phosphate transporter domain-containing protein n=1 Tax=Salix dunnii TaxID=1413687 RepID=A0A835MY02_9ROSI|nr:hypothetical protein SADUNF_Sadunf06G0223000 [Salix dunnii]
MELNGCNVENRNRGSHDDSEEDKSVPFDIENARRRNSDADFDVNGIAIDSLSSKKYPPTPVSAADILKTLFFILVWYTFSTFLTLYNKTLLGDDMGRFPAPLLMNTVHFTMQAVLSTAITWYWSDRFRPNVAMSWKDYFIRGTLHTELSNESHGFGIRIPWDRKWTFPFTVVPTALGTAFDVNLSNVSLVFISVTFATMCKSAAPIFLILFAFAFRLESPSAKLFGIIMVISIGILLTGGNPEAYVAKETEFEFWGFVFVMLAAVMSGFRWCMTQILLQVQKLEGLKNPLTLMSYVTPVMAISTGLLSLVLTEFVLISVTSAVTVTIAGVVKEAVTILCMLYGTLVMLMICLQNFFLFIQVAVIYFHDKFTWLKGVGLLIIMVGVGLFNWYKYQKLQKGQTSENDSAGSSPKNVATKYVILDEMDVVDDDT